MSEQGDNPEQEEGEKIIDADDIEDQEDEESKNLREKITNFHNEIKQGLKNIQKIEQEATYAYVQLILKGKEFDNLYAPLLNYKYLRVLDISENPIVDISAVTKLQYLVHLDASKTEVKTLQVFNPVSDEEVLPYLQYLNLSGTKITQLETLKLVQIRSLNLSECQIQSAEKFEGNSTLQLLDLRLNKLKSVQGIRNMPQLTTLILDENEITDICNLENLNNLRNLSLAKNKIKKLTSPLPNLPSLYNINLAGNEIDVFMQFVKLQAYESLYQLSLQDNPFVIEMEAKLEILIWLKQLTHVNEQEIIAQDRLDSINLLNDRRLKQEEDQRLKDEEKRILKEEEDRLKEEEAAKLREQEEARLKEEQIQQELLQQQQQQQLQEQQLQQQAQQAQQQQEEVVVVQQSQEQPADEQK